MTDRMDLGMRDPFEQAFAATLQAHALRAAGAPSAEAVDRAVGIGPALVHRPGRWGAARAIPRRRGFVLLALALALATTVAAFVGARLYLQQRPPAIPAAVTSSLRIFAKGAPGPLELWNWDTQRFEVVSDRDSTHIAPDGLRVAQSSSCSACPLTVADVALGDRHKPGNTAFTRMDLSSGGWGLGPYAWSPDSHFLARIANGSLDIADVLGDPTADQLYDQLPVRTIAVPAAGTPAQIAWSDDGRSIALISESGALDVVDVTLGGARELLGAGTFAVGPSRDPVPLFWSPDGGSLLTMAGQRPVIVALGPPANVRTLPVLAGAEAIVGWSPDGRVVLAGTATSDADVVGAGIPTGGCDATPAWSAADGRAARLVGGDLQVGVLNGEMATIATGLCHPGDLATVTWSASGAWIVVEVVSERAPGSGAYAFHAALVPSGGGSVVVVAEDDRPLGHQVRWAPPGA